TTQFATTQFATTQLSPIQRPPKQAVALPVSPRSIDCQQGSANNQKRPKTNALIYHQLASGSPRDSRR
ncbi:MAG: hypothetical protein ACPGLY_12415, partial [Rubripirellula sp.]